MTKSINVNELACYLYTEHDIQLRDIGQYTMKILEARGVPHASIWQNIYGYVRDHTERNCADKYMQNFKQKIKDDVSIEDIAAYLEEHQEQIVYASSRRCNLPKVYKMIYAKFAVLREDLYEVTRSVLFRLAWDSEAEKVNEMRCLTAINGLTNAADEWLVHERIEIYKEYPSIEDMMSYIRSNKPEILAFQDDMYGDD